MARRRGRNKIKVLVTSVGSTNGINVLNALKDKGEYEIIAGDADELSAGLYFVKRKYIFPKANNHAFIPALMQVMKYEMPDVIMPTYSEEIIVLSEFKNAFEEFGIKMCLSPMEVYIITENKIVCSSILNKLNIDTPRIFKDKPKYPAIIKPIQGSGTRGVFKLENEKDWEYHKKEDCFVSEFIEGQEYTIDGLSDLEGNPIASIPRKRLKVKGGLCVAGITERNKELSELAERIAKYFKMVGAWNIQVIKNKKRTVVIDVNNRFPSGGLPLAVASGLNMPDLMIRMLMGEKIKKPKIRYGLRVLRFQSSLIIDKNYNRVA